MHAPDWFCSVHLAYMGLGSGIELIPYFLALIGLLGAASLAVVQWPLFALIRWWRKRNGPRVDLPPETPSRASEPQSESPP